MKVLTLIIYCFLWYFQSFGAFIIYSIHLLWTTTGSGTPTYAVNHNLFHGEEADTLKWKTQGMLLSLCARKKTKCTEWLVCLFHHEDCRHVIFYYGGFSECTEWQSPCHSRCIHYATDRMTSFLGEGIYIIFRLGEMRFCYYSAWLWDCESESICCTKWWCVCRSEPVFSMEIFSNQIEIIFCCWLWVRNLNQMYMSMKLSS